MMYQCLVSANCTNSLTWNAQYFWDGSSWLNYLDEVRLKSYAYVVIWLYGQTQPQICEILCIYKHFPNWNSLYIIIFQSFWWKCLCLWTRWLKTQRLVANTSTTSRTPPCSEGHSHVGNGQTSAEGSIQEGHYTKIIRPKWTFLHHVLWHTILRSMNCSNTSWWDWWVLCQIRSHQWPTPPPTKVAKSKGNPW